MAVAPKPDYLSRDYAGLRQSLLSYAHQRFPEWQPASEGDFGLVLLELWAYMGDIISYYTDRAQFENYITTATQRDSILNLAFMLGYIPNAGTPATGTIRLTTSKKSKAITVPAGSRFTTNRVDSIDGPLTFETTEDASIPANPEGTIPSVLVPVVEGITVKKVYLGESSGQPGQVFLLPNTGVYHDTIQVFVEDQNGATSIDTKTKAREWEQVSRLMEGDAGDKIFEPRFTSTATRIYFGDDINGLIPATGLRIWATYRYGHGSTGNVAAGLVRFVNSPNLGTVRVAQDPDTGAFLSSEMTGGAHPESDDSIRRNAPRVYRSQDRAVTEQDFAEIALGTPGVTSANVVVGTFTSVTIFITGSDGGPPSDALKEAVYDRLEGKTLAGVTVTIGEPEYVEVNFGYFVSEGHVNNKPVLIEVKKGHDLANVRAAARRTYTAVVDSLDFGEALTVGKIYEALQRIDGVVNVEIPVMVRDDAAVQSSGTDRIVPKPWEVLKVGTIHQNVVRKQSSNYRPPE